MLKRRLFNFGLLFCVLVVSVVISILLGACIKDNQSNNDTSHGSDTDIDGSDADNENSDQGGSDGSTDIQPNEDDQFDYELEISNEGYIITSYIGSDKDVIIPSSYDNKNIVSIGPLAFSANRIITSLVIPDTIKTVGEYAFADCTFLKSVDLGEGVTTIGKGAFRNCYSLNKIVLPNSLDKLGNNVFEGCANIVSASGPSIVIAEIPKEELTDVQITAGEELLDKAFADCGKLKNVILPDGLKTIGYDAFYNCVNLVSIEIPDGVTEIGSEAFSKCSSLKDITIPSSVKIINDSAFAYCEGITSLTIPENVTDIGANAFIGCSLEQINYNAINCNDSKYSPFVDGYRLELSKIDNVIVKIGADVTKIPSKLFAVEMFPGNYLHIVSVEFAENNKCTSIGSYAFYGCQDLESIEIPENITYLGQEVFGNCINLKQINFNATACEDLQDYHGILEGSQSMAQLETVTVNIGANVSRIPANLFASNSYNAPKAIKVLFADGSICSEIGDNAFSMCKGIDIDIPNGVTIIGNNVFRGSTINRISLPQTLVTIGVEAFGACSLISIKIPDSVRSIGEYAFGSCTDLKSVYIDDIESWMMITFEDEYANPLINGAVGKIGDYSFVGCKSIKDIIIPSSITTIGLKAFYGCSSLVNIYYEDTIPKWLQINIDDGNSAITEANVYYYSETEPVDIGNFWHYGDDKSTVVIWTKESI